MITTQLPDGWRDLQDQVHNILAQCGFSVETEKVVENARGAAEIDVYAEEYVNGRKYSIVCECKNWKSKIPQNVIHGFRAVLADIGAHLGIIITTSDYQTGAAKASEFTNVQLLTWDQFQSEFEKQWLESHFHPTITEALDPLFTYAEPIPPIWLPRLNEEDRKRFFELRDKYTMFGVFMQSLSQWGRPFSEDLTLPLKAELVEKYKLGRLPNEILLAEGYKEFLDLCLLHGGQAIREFREIRDRYYSPQEKVED
ncbi:restriction endonuclease [Pseudodesulfovibrio indicus]|uniref:restriction endonuclease n=1 Tax=Pseudodesulfovibrio indicus TaxID=1716143 RepID=UPI00292E2E19|nr:restriction endonuclease [Pseudodesulfovibrio indicus]